MNIRLIHIPIIFSAMFAGNLMVLNCNAQVQLQQPTIARFGVATTVSVPDRATMQLGRSNQALESSQQSRFGPFNSSSSRGLSQRSLTVTPWIHDLAEMDRELLSRPSHALPLPYEVGYSDSINRFSTQSVAENPARRRARSPSFRSYEMSVESQASNQQRVADQYLNQGIAALEQNRFSLARIYFALADKNGNAAARQLLKQMAKDQAVGDAR